jgi:hypothetical protein
MPRLHQSDDVVCGADAPAASRSGSGGWQDHSPAPPGRDDRPHARLLWLTLGCSTASGAVCVEEVGYARVRPVRPKPLGDRERARVPKVPSQLRTVDAPRSGQRSRCAVLLHARRPAARRHALRAPLKALEKVSRGNGPVGRFK